MTQLLVIEDEDRIASFVEKGLRSSGYTTARAATGAEALGLLGSETFDLIVLDLGLPDIDGFDVLRRLRAGGSQVPVVILTARGSVRDTVAGLDGGADDYLSKPFRFEELLARVRARLRTDSKGDPAVLTHGDASLDLRTRRLLVDEEEVDLTAREFALAETFFRNADQVLSREQLLAAAWGLDHDPGSNVVDVYVGYLRRKLGAERIDTVRGMGYRFVGIPLPEESRPRVLVIEDEARLSWFVAKRLRKAGWDAVVAEDGAVGMFLVTTERFDAVVLDLGLPDTDGLEILAGIRSRDADLPVVVLTGRDEPASRQACEAAGASAVLTKPLTFSELSAELSQRLDERKLG